MKEYIKDGKGKTIGWTDGNRAFDRTGKNTAWVRDNRTYDSTGKYVGNGDQKIRSITEKDR